METSIQIFENPQFGNVRVTMRESNEPLFCAKDVATALGYSDTNDAISRHCKSGEKVFHPHTKSHKEKSIVMVEARPKNR